MPSRVERILAATRAADRASKPTGTAVKQERARLIGVILAEEAKAQNGDGDGDPRELCCRGSRG